MSRGGIRVRRKAWRLERRCGHSFISNELQPSSVVVDLGVNRGEFATWVADRFGCSVFGAEPDPELYRLLPAHKALRILSTAVGGQNGHAVLRRPFGKCPTLFDDAISSVESLEVEAVDLARFFDLAGLAECSRIDLVKVDIEGAELPMFESAPDQILTRVAQFTVEFHDFLWPAQTQRIDRVKSRLHDLGFRSINFSLDNTDVLFLNRKFLDVGLMSELGLRIRKYVHGVGRRIGWS